MDEEVRAFDVGLGDMVYLDEFLDILGELKEFLRI